ncbi:MAG: hypothetical protein ACK4LQ_06615 [Pararhodobacter sp.]
MAAPCRLVPAILSLFLCCTALPVTAADTLSDSIPETPPGTAGAAIAIELNQTDTQAAACRMVFLATNALVADIERLVLEVVLFDQAQRVAAMTLLDFQDLPAGRSRVRSFDLAGHDCQGFVRLLVNGVAECAGAGLSVPRCERALAVSARTALEVVQ